MDDLIAEAVGRRVRRRRRLLGMTQQDLGRACGVTFQQIQKYESASCRISATLLWKLARALDVEVGYFYAGLEQELARGAPMPAGGGNVRVLRLAV
jgi:transcriptional regulator with XRE-family HTH domain